MSSKLEKAGAIQGVASAIHTGTPNEGEVEKQVAVLVQGASVTVDAPATTYAYTHNDQDQYLKLTGLTAATTINLTAGTEISIGATLTIDIVQGGTGYNLVLGTGIVGDDLVGVANDRDVVVLKYTAVDTWVVVSNTKIVDAA